MTDAPLIFRDVPLNDGEAATVTLEVPAQRAVSVVGEEKSGIALIGRIALGFVTPKSGQMTVLGTELSTLPKRGLLAYRRRVGYLPAGNGLLQNHPATERWIASAVRQRPLRERNRKPVEHRACRSGARQRRAPATGTGL